MTDRQRQVGNLEILLDEFFHGEETSALAMFKVIGHHASWAGYPEVLRSLLFEPRPLNPSASSQAEHLLWDVEELLDFYSFLELGAMMGAIPSNYPDFLPEVESILREPVLRRFYEKRYSQQLLSGALLRLGPNRTVRTQECPPEIFHLLAELKDSIDTDRSIQALLYAAGGQAVRGWDTSDVFLALAEPAGCIDAMIEDALGETDLGGLLLGFFRFVAFCERLNDVLTRLTRSPVLQSACWHYFADRWFVHPARLAQLLSRGVLSISRWKREPMPKTLSLKGLQQPATFLPVIEVIFSEQYATRYRFAPPKLDRGWAKRDIAEVSTSILTSDNPIPPNAGR